MAVRNPEDIHRAFTMAFNAGDLDALMALYEPGASLAPAPGQTVSGTDAIRRALAEFLALRGQMTIATLRSVVCGDLALLHGSWTLVGTGPDGTAVELEGRDTEVVRKQGDGDWRFVIDNPFGDARSSGPSGVLLLSLRGERERAPSRGGVLECRRASALHCQV